MNNYLKLIKGPIIDSKNTNYNKARTIWNRAFNKYPFLIIYPLDEEDVSNCIKYVSFNKLNFRIRSGGHCYEGYCILDYGVVIDLSYMNQISFNENDNTLIIAPGAINSMVYEQVSKLGYIFPGGDCHDVAISGYTLGGGWNYLSRMFGLGIDSLSELEMIDYKGKLVKANENTNNDLFWACKGAGSGNFGVITKLKFNLTKKMNYVTLIEFDYIVSDKLAAQKFFDVWDSCIDEIDNRLTLTSSFEKVNNNIKISGTGIFLGDIIDAEASIKYFRKLQNININLNNILYKEAMDKIIYSSPPFEKMQKFGLFNYQKLENNQIEEIVSLLNNIDDSKTKLILYSMGGEIANRSSADSAFFYRNARYIIGFQISWENEVNAYKYKEYLYKCYLIIRKYTKGAYLNNPYINLYNYKKEYYGLNLNKIIKIKNKYDPDNFFTYEQGI